MTDRSLVLLVVVLSLLWPAASLYAGPVADSGSPVFGVIGMGGGAFDALKAGGDEFGVPFTHLTGDAFRDAAPDLSGFDAIFVSFASADLSEAYRKAVLGALDRNPDLKIFCVGPPAVHSLWSDWVGEDNVRFDPEMARYYGLSRESMKNMVQYTLNSFFGWPGKAPPPDVQHAVRIYHPQYGQFEDVDAFLARAQEDGWDLAESPRVALGTWRHHATFHQPKVVNALIEELRKQGILAVCIIADDPGFRERMRTFAPDLVIMTSHTREGADFWTELGVPRIHALWFNDESIDDWSKNNRTGMTKTSEQHQLGSAELRGATETLTAGGTRSGGDAGEEILPIPDRIERIAGRARAWIDLAAKENGKKRVAIVIYDREADKSGLMSGPAHCLNAPKSLVRLLEELQKEGYDVTGSPSDADELVERVADHGRQLGSWEPAALDRLARSGEAVLVPEEQYRAWFEEKVPPEQREDVIRHWGAPPGKLMVWEDGGKRYLVLPRVDLGNVSLVTQPPKGETITATVTGQDVQNENLLPPTHHYLATYFWMQQGFKADAVVHFGSHGSEWLFPGKQAVLSRSDWSDMLLGDMPNVNPWLVSNTAELTPCKRRARAVTVGFVPPPLMEAGLSEELLNLESTIDKYLALDHGALRNKFAETITEQAEACNLSRELDLRRQPGALLDDEQIAEISTYLHDLKNEAVPAGMHVLGEPPEDALLVPYLVGAMGKRFSRGATDLFVVPGGAGDAEAFLNRKGEEILRLMIREGLSPEEAVQAVGGSMSGGTLPEAVRESLEMAVQMREGFMNSRREIDNILGALDGRFVPPGPSGLPERNPGVVPAGRNIYVLNPEELPTRSSWELGTRLIDAYLEKELSTKGRYPRKVGFSLVPFATYSDYGIIESQILYLMGVRPVWDSRNRVRDVELIPASELGRPRIDVFLSARSIYRDELPSLMTLLDKAVRLAASAREEDNYVYEDSAVAMKELERQGLPVDQAVALSRARIFGAEPDEILDSHNWFFYLTERSGEWEDREQLLDVYLQYCKHVYTEGAWGENAPEAFDAAIQGTELILRSWYDNRDFVLSNKFAWWVDGTLSLAVKHLTGKEPDYLFVDVRDADEADIVDSSSVVQKDFRVRLANPRWIQAMMKEGYPGGSMIAKNVDNLMGWEIMRAESVPDSNWEDLVEVYVRDRDKLGIREWFDRENPHAFQKLAVTMLETIRKGYWKPGIDTTREITEAYARSVAVHGKGGGIREGGNEKLEGFVELTLSAPGNPEMASLLESFRQQSSAAKRGAEPDRSSEDPVRGQRLELTDPAKPARPWTESALVLVAIGLVSLLIVALGFRRTSTTLRETAGGPHD